MSTELLDDDNIQQRKNKKIKIRPYIIWLTFLGIGYLFKVLHWPWFSIITLTSTAGITAYALNEYLNIKRRNYLNTAICLLGALWLLILMWGITFNNGQPFNKFGFGIYMILFFIYFTTYFLINRYREKRAMKSR